MREARIQCLCQEFPVHDLSLRLRKGQVEFVPEDAARQSKDLKHATQIKAVQVRYVERFRTMKKPDPPPRPLPPSVGLSRPSHRPPVPDPEPDPEAVDTEAVRQVVREELERQGSPSVIVSQEALEAALRNIMGDIPLMAPAPGHCPTPRDAEDDAPQFIPESIVPKDAEADIQLDTVAGGAEALDEAAAALKATKPKRKRATRKKTTRK